MKDFPLARHGESKPDPEEPHHQNTPPSAFGRKTYKPSSRFTFRENFDQQETEHDHPAFQNNTMAAPQDIAQTGSDRRVSYSLGVSPTATFHSPLAGSQGLAGSVGLAQRLAPKQLKPFNTEDIKILLLENVNQTGREILKQQGYQVEFLKTSLPEDQLIEKIR